MRIKRKFGQRRPEADPVQQEEHQPPDKQRRLEADPVQQEEHQAPNNPEIDQEEHQHAPLGYCKTNRPPQEDEEQQIPCNPDKPDHHPEELRALLRNERKYAVSSLSNDAITDRSEALLEMNTLMKLLEYDEHRKLHIIFNAISIFTRNFFGRNQVWVDRREKILARGNEALATLMMAWNRLEPSRFPFDHFWDNYKATLGETNARDGFCFFILKDRFFHHIPNPTVGLAHYMIKVLSIHLKIHETEASTRRMVEELIFRSAKFLGDASQPYCHRPSITAASAVYAAYAFLSPGDRETLDELLEFCGTLPRFNQGLCESLASSLESAAVELLNRE
ncbi:hypothetical protein Tsubulata_031495 [Turnera subulata]|uniref:Uncharacterized protein n=1 Tax=Turnera subulata TaxID=218843 RepID=A0A9Q0F7P2_9ROSI|nr:hypothetical protein Tsubulata_031495 [Turnera subulata]